LFELKAGKVTQRCCLGGKNLLSSSEIEHLQVSFNGLFKIS